MRNFDRILTILANYERGEFDLRGLEYRLEVLVERNVQIFSPGPSRRPTCVGMAPVLWSEG